MAQAAAVSIDDTAFRHRNLVGLVLPSHWLWKEVTKGLNASSPQFHNHKGCHPLALRHTRLLEKGCRIPTPEIQCHQSWKDESTPPSPLARGRFPKQIKQNLKKPQTKPESHAVFHIRKLISSTCLYKQLYRAKIFKACTFYKDHTRVTVLFSAYCIYKYKSVNFVSRRISRYYIFQLKDNVRIKLQSLSVWNNYVFLNLKWLL